MIFLFNYLKLAIWSSIYFYKPNELLLKIVHKNIDDCGCIAVKFVQWMLPKIEVMYDINKKTKENQWFYDFEEFYDKCKTHSLEETNKIYQKDFNRKLEEDYTIDEIIASGSIGQVYKVQDKNNNYYALKVLHPNMRSQIYFLEFIIWLLYTFPLTKNYLRYKLPVSLKDFISDFKLQTNLINEGNNCIQFYHEYKENDYIIIPEVFQLSKNILVMSYEEGEKFENITVSDYKKSQIQMIFKLFIKHNQYYFFMHGDLHKGNWKVRDNEKIVIYDFGYCWHIPIYLQNSFDIVDKAFLDIDNPEKVKIEFVEAIYVFLNKSVNKSIIKSEVDKLSKIMKCGDPSFLLKLMINCLWDSNVLLESYVLQSLIIHNQLQRNLEKYNVTITNKSGKMGEISNTYYKKQITDIICFCETKNIFEKYRKHLQEEYENECIILNELFETVNFNIPNLKELAIS